MAALCVTCLGYCNSRGNCFSICGDKFGIRLVANVVPIGLVDHGCSYGGAMSRGAERGAPITDQWGVWTERWRDNNVIAEQDTLLMESGKTGIPSVRSCKRAAEVVEALKACGVVPVIRTSTLDLARTAVDWLSEAGMQTFEITLTTPGATSLIADLALSGADQLIGAGTVTSEVLARDAIASGARYIVSPGLSRRLGICVRSTM